VFESNDPHAKTPPPVPTRDAAPQQRRVLLVEADPQLAQVIARELSRRHVVAVAATVPQAIAALTKGPRYHVVIAAQKIGDHSSGVLFAALNRRWPHLRRVLYTEAAARRVSADTLAHAIVETSASFQKLLEQI
jgi:ActR/RegA family two-component response regulator